MDEGPVGATGSRPARRANAPRRLDVRIVVGLLLVLVSMVVGARVVSAADETVAVWSVREGLAAGTVLSAADLAVAQVRLEARTAYVLASEQVDGAVLGRDLGPGELLPSSALGAQDGGRLVSIPVEATHAPADLRRGARVDVYGTYDAGTAAARTEVVLAGVPVQDVQRSQGLTSGARISVVVRVAEGEVEGLVRALQNAAIDISGVAAAE